MFIKQKVPVAGPEIRTILVNKKGNISYQLHSTAVDTLSKTYPRPKEEELRELNRLNLIREFPNRSLKRRRFPTGERSRPFKPGFAL